MHIGGIELGHHYTVSPGRVGDAKTQDAILEAGPRVDRGKPVKRLVTLLVRIAVTPINNLLSWNCLFPYKGEVQSSRSGLYKQFVPIFL